jgi:hypothetical protein
LFEENEGKKKVVAGSLGRSNETGRGFYMFSFCFFLSLGGELLLWLSV